MIFPKGDQREIRAALVGIEKITVSVTLSASCSGSQLLTPTKFESKQLSLFQNTLSQHRFLDL
jgi:hypothetical protein